MAGKNFFYFTNIFLKKANFQISHADKKPFLYKKNSLRLFLSWYIPWSCKPKVSNKVNVFILQDNRENVTLKDLKNLHKSFVEEEKPDNFDADSLKDILAVSANITNGCKESLRLQIIGTDPSLPADTKRIIKTDDGRLYVTHNDEKENEISG